MLDEICREINNYFVKSKVCGEFSVIDGKITPSNFLQDGQYFRIVGSVFNDGVYCDMSAIVNSSTNTTHDEIFAGEVWAMAVPPTFIALTSQIKAYVDNGSANPSAYTSESFGGYSYTKATDANGVPLSWEKVFAKQLNKYRRISL